MDTIGVHLAPIWKHWAPIWLPFGFLSRPFGSLLVPFGAHFLPLAYLVGSHQRRHICGGGTAALLQGKYISIYMYIICINKDMGAGRLYLCTSLLARLTT